MIAVLGLSELTWAELVVVVAVPVAAATVVLLLCTVLGRLAENR